MKQCNKGTRARPAWPWCGAAALSDVGIARHAAEADVADYLGRAMGRLNPVDSRFESAWFQLLKLKCDELLSSFAFNFNLRRYTWEPGRSCPLPASRRA
jgi:hypothetical protein